MVSSLDFYFREKGKFWGESYNGLIVCLEIIINFGLEFNYNIVVLLSLGDRYYSWGKFKLLEDVDRLLEKGEIYRKEGRNGSGGFLWVFGWDLGYVY